MASRRVMRPPASTWSVSPFAPMPPLDTTCPAWDLGSGPALRLGLLFLLHGTMCMHSGSESVVRHRLVDHGECLDAVTVLVSVDDNDENVVIVQVELLSQPCDGPFEPFVFFPLTEAVFQLDTCPPFVDDCPFQRIGVLLFFLQVPPGLAVRSQAVLLGQDP